MNSLALNALLLLAVCLALCQGFSSTSPSKGAIGFRRSISVSHGVRTVLRGHTIDGVAIDGELKPLADNVLVKVKTAQRQTASGIIIPEAAQERPTEGSVVAVGTGRLHRDTGALIETQVNAGESVVFGKYHGVELQYDGEPHTMIRAEDVLFKYTGEGGDALAVEDVECTRDNVLIELPMEEDNAAGLVVAADKQPKQGTVVKAGKGKQANSGALLPMPVAVGDKVRFREYAGIKVKIGGRDYVVMEANNILAKF